MARGGEAAPAGHLDPPGLLSFLKEQAAAPHWTERDLSASLRVSSAEASSAIAIMAAAGYVEPAGTGKWKTTRQGNLVAGSTAARFKRESVKAAISGLLDRITTFNSGENAAYRVVRAAVFGDYLGSAPMLQPAEIALELESRSPAAPASTEKEKEDVLRTLKARSPMLNLHVLKPWMLSRSHLVLVAL